MFKLMTDIMEFER